ncbi:hypothetical protein WR25_14105 [Diploscapter pachys]|uniref:Uncharacterized protein n=1 Tax=Diploscapter pachys TaxID=2018661 RepID=A0A2A2M4G6_9BILA|nr:hypothetical protein WR25_14105 [Diploscapter pachys]
MPAPLSVEQADRPAAVPRRRSVAAIGLSVMAKVARPHEISRFVTFAPEASHPAVEYLIGRAVAVRPHADVLNDPLARRLTPFECRRAHVRRHHHIGQRKQARIDPRFVLPDVEPGSGESTRLQRIDQRDLVHDAAARGVDQIDVRPHQPDTGVWIVTMSASPSRSSRSAWKVAPRSASTTAGRRRRL